jgi:phosphatidylglycerol---prolipoprotein diacylglyceryl transferase
MIPSPPINHISIGFVTIHFYGLIIALSIITCYIVGLRIAKYKTIKPTDVEFYFLTILPASFIGARMYHVITNWDYYSKNLQMIPAIWNGGLGLFGGVIAGITTLYFITKAKKISLFAVSDLLAVLLPLGHAIGRWGNYVNQELFGRPTDLPWGVLIDKNNRPAKYSNNSTFHPTFLYESILNFINFGILYFLYTKKNLPVGTITALYFINYGIIRFIIELIKIDPDVSSQIGPLRIPQYTSIAFILLGAAILWKKLYRTK